MIDVLPLTAVGRDDVERVGGKAANLGALIAAGLPVPAGFVVTTDAYRCAIAAAEVPVARRVADGEVARLRAEIESVALPGALRAAMVGAYTELGGPVAVRSSATAEDLPGAAFAGQQDTVLDVAGHGELVGALRRCWASLWSDRAVAYRTRLGIDPAEVAIAVVVQRMVPAETAGVMFTADPVSGDRERIVIDAAIGLADTVVSGAVTPQHYELDRAGLVMAAPDARVLSRERLATLGELGVAVEELFGYPQDIEWAAVDDRVELVQARPMTALPPPPLQLGRVARTVGAVMLELVPRRPYPMDMSTWVTHGPADMMSQIADFYGIRDPFHGWLREDSVGVVYRLVPHAPRPTVRAISAPWRLATRARRHDPARWTEDTRYASFDAELQALGGLDLAAMNWLDLRAVPRRALAAVQPVTDLRIDYLPRAVVALARLALLVTVLGRRGLLGDLLIGAPTRTGDANRALEDLAAVVRADPDLAVAVAARDRDAVAGFTAFDAAFRRLLAEFGHRETVSAILASPPTWGDDPATVLGLVNALATGPGHPPRSDDATARLLTHPLLRSAVLRTGVRRVVERAQAGVGFREDTHFAMTRPLPVLRRALLEIGGRLVAARVLATPEVVFHLRLEEVEAIADLDRIDVEHRERLRASVAARAARRAELAGVRLIDPRSLFGRRVQRDDGAALATGTPSGGGAATGPVRVIADPAAFNELRPGDVLVCPYTNPSWTPLFARAVAVVVDTGGMGSHAAIVAREYGVPAVMGTGSGTTDLRTGQIVTVDGDTGRVTAAASTTAEAGNP